MILRPAAKRKPKTEAVSGDRRRQVSYAYIDRRGCREIRITKVTPDGNKRPSSPEISPFSALLEDSKKRQCIGESPLQASVAPVCRNPLTDLWCSKSTEISTTSRSAMSPTQLQPDGILDPTIDLCVSLTKCHLEDSPTILQTAGAPNKPKFTDWTPRVATSPGQRTKHSPEGTNEPPTTPIIQGCPVIPESPLLHYLSPAHSVPLSDREKALALCKQTTPIPLQDFFTDNMVATITKLGEGAFAEVFGCQNGGREKLALKIVPVEGDFKYNDEHQSTFSEILPEMVVTRELSLLGEEGNKENRSVPHFTRNFLQIDRMGVCVGEYPGFLMDAWEDYDFQYNSENDKPDVFPPGQLYVVFSAKDAGIPLEEYVFQSFEEAHSVLAQVAATLAVGEAALEFEHRDLHRSNVLVRRTHQESAYFRLNNRDHFIKTHGVMATIVDYTLSRIRQGKCVSYNNLNRLGWLFTGNGDIQFEVYRQMKDATKSKWELYLPHTNVLWLNYLVTKISQCRKLKNTSSRTWRAKFRPYLKVVLQYSSAQEAFVNLFHSEQ